MTKPVCAVAVLPAEGGDPDRLLRSLSDATATGLGDLAAVEVLSLDATTPRGALAQAGRTVEEGGYAWLLAVSAAETLVPDIFVKTAPALRLHDAVWGGAGLAATGRLERITRLAAQDEAALFHAALQWWIGPTHFIRPEKAIHSLHATDKAGWYADHMLALWRAGRAYKTAQCLTLFHGPLPPVAEADRERLIEALAADPVYMRVQHGPHVVRLPYTGVNPVIEREQSRGLFFEQEELAFLAARLPKRMRIVDAGANTGNHTLFFATVMQADSVIPIEPLPRAMQAIRDAVAANGLSNVDLSLLGQAVGDAAGRFAPLLSVGGGLGATRLVPDDAGSVPVLPLDTLVSGQVDFIKIDVEGMEMAVLAGAQSLIARCRPVIYIEVLDATIGPFMRWVDAHAYRIEKLFPDKTHCNYLLIPAEQA